MLYMMHSSTIIYICSLKGAVTASYVRLELPLPQHHEHSEARRTLPLTLCHWETHAPYHLCYRLVGGRGGTRGAGGHWWRNGGHCLERMALFVVIRCISICLQKFRLVGCRRFQWCKWGRVKEYGCCCTACWAITTTEAREVIVSHEWLNEDTRFVSLTISQWVTTVCSITELGWTLCC
jgi:hypothetical protein